uniref:EF-hand domain-containing protein n=1 Tax=Crocodylus porosus TaxID=8502 RepID=A0A7M4F5V1_CROPO
MRDGWEELECIVNIYHQYAFRHPMDDYLQKNEFKKLLKEQAKYLESLFRKADVNRDGRIKFTEFLITLASVAIDVHNTSHKPGHGHGHSHDA